MPLEVKPFRTLSAGSTGVTYRRPLHKLLPILKALIWQPRLRLLQRVLDTEIIRVVRTKAFLVALPERSLEEAQLAFLTKYRPRRTSRRGCYRSLVQSLWGGAGLFDLSSHVRFGVISEHSLARAKFPLCARGRR
jgi:hypothetical protein